MASQLFAVVHPELTAGDNNSALVAVSNEYIILAWPDEDITIFTVINDHLCNMVKQIYPAAYAFVDDELLPIDLAVVRPLSTTWTQAAETEHLPRFTNDYLIFEILCHEVVELQLRVLTKRWLRTRPVWCR